MRAPSLSEGPPCRARPHIWLHHLDDPALDAILGQPPRQELNIVLTCRHRCLYVDALENAACEIVSSSTLMQRWIDTAGPDVAWPFSLEGGRYIPSRSALPTMVDPLSWKRTCAPRRSSWRPLAGRCTGSLCAPTARPSSARVSPRVTRFELPCWRFANALGVDSVWSATSVERQIRRMSWRVKDSRAGFDSELPLPHELWRNPVYTAPRMTSNP
jgi:hypothetical protein